MFKPKGQCAYGSIAALLSLVMLYSDIFQRHAISHTVKVVKSLTL